MALDSFFVNAISADATHAAKAYYAGNIPPPTNPYPEGTEQHRIWRRARMTAANAECVAQYSKNRNKK